MATNLTVLTPCNFFFLKNLYTVPELEIVIQSEIVVISTETLTKVMNNFILRSNEMRDYRVHHV
jgi:hypothetical protein